ncbi:MAG TPA: histone deacetylase family protein [Methylococcaceae bacterium]|nr:histone deacetylase family protein [Methylococcaceae bacterium]
MKVAYVTHPACRLHVIVPGHPESPERLQAIETKLQTDGLLDRMSQITAHPATLEQLGRVHAAAYLDGLEHMRPEPGQYAFLDPDTGMNHHTWDALLAAAGAGVTAVDAIFRGEIERAFCNVRPPGHHAEKSKAMGFCFVDNVAVAAAHAIHVHGLKRVAIVDFDVHHGNGTEDIFRDEPRVLFCSTFQHPLYPHNGADTQSDHILNVPLPAGTGSASYRAAFSRRILPALQRFEPEMVFFSAGFDAHRDDPLASMELEEADYYWLTRAVLDATQTSASGRAVSLLEGGYHLPALAASATAHVRALLEKD